MNDYIYQIVVISLVAVVFIYWAIVIVNRLSKKSNISKAEKILEEYFTNSERDIKISINNYIKTIDVDNFDFKYKDKGDQFKQIENAIVDYGFNKASYIIKEIIEKDFPDKKGLYELILNAFTEEKINDFVFKILEDQDIQDNVSIIYNKIFEDEIEKIEKEDKELEEELYIYEKEPIKDETVEQHNQSIEEYAKSHIQEKIDEMNTVYDEIEKTNPNVVPVRDLRDLTALIDDEEIIPPSDEESDTIEDDGSIEIIEYLDNITDNTLKETEE